MPHASMHAQPSHLVQHLWLQESKEEKGEKKEKKEKDKVCLEANMLCCLCLFLRSVKRSDLRKECGRKFWRPSRRFHVWHSPPQQGRWHF